MRLEVVRYDESRRSAVASLQQHLWSRDPAVIERILAWRYEENPLVERPFVYLLLVDGEVAGMRGFLPSTWRHGDRPETTLLLCACDLVLDPKHQAKGLVRHLMSGALGDLARQGHRQVLSFSAGPATALLSERQGFRRVVDYDPIALKSASSKRLRRGRAMLARLGGRVGESLAHRLEGPALGRLDHATGDRELRPGVVASDQPRLAAMVELMGRTPEDPARLRPAPTTEELAWRFRNPQRRYRFLYCEDAGSLLGFIALSARKSGASEVVIVDRRAASPEVEARLLEVLAREGGVPRLLTWSAGLSGSTLELLRRIGFARFDASRGVRRYRPGFLVRPTAGLDDPASWQLFGRDIRTVESWELRPLLSDAY